MADAENARLRAELEATRAQLAQSQAANAAARPGEVAVPIAEGVPAPGEATPLTGQPLPRQHSVVAMGKAVQDNKLAAGSSSQTCMGILFAIACLYIYYINGGDQVSCSTKLPFFLKVNGFASIAYILTTAVLVYLSTRGKLSSESASFRGLACITSLVGCFLFAWFICGLVRPRHFEQLKLGLGLGLGAGLGLGLGLRLGLRPRLGLVLRTARARRTPHAPEALLSWQVWFFKTSEAECDPGLYKGSEIYFILTLVVPLVFCCLLSCCMCCLLGAQGASGMGPPDLRRP